MYFPHIYMTREKWAGGVVAYLILFLSSSAKHHVFKMDPSSC